jgi:hypothetical protein
VTIASAGLLKRSVTVDLYETITRGLPECDAIKASLHSCFRRDFSLGDG